MRRNVLALCVLIGCFLAPHWLIAGEPTLVYLVRHAEKVDESRDPDLSAAGEARAKALAQFLQDVPLDWLVCSQFKRTRQTLMPLATDQDLEPTTVAAGQPDKLVDAIRERVGQTIVIAGHSNTVPDLIARLGGPKVVIDHDDYTNLFLLIIDGDQTLMQRFRFQP